ncbi:hypothetical protein [Flavobacterium hungaricum]|uniref:Uncharacterized protein n=1 Tax=Flavobacterium hungaricum TaxID=2082725 RepID=A0ABR9TRG6_9FLAO|nr:hypothetical protein [Flavobacterium hungaricum]MBE8727963.1 hypothetical protein [Flavobacterium hungaricum]
MNELRKWEVVEHSWSDTSIYDQDGNVVCTMCIDDEDTTEENQEEREQIVSANFKLIEASPDMLDVLKRIVKEFEKYGGQHVPLVIEANKLINKIEF